MNPPQTQVAVAEIVDESRAVALKSTQINELSGMHVQFKEILLKIGKLGIHAANTARSIGLILQAMCGHKHMEKAYFDIHLKGHVPFDFEMAKWYVWASNNHPEVIEDVRDAAALFLPGFEAVGMIEAPARGESQKPSDFPLIQKFLKQITANRGLFVKAITDRPAESWTRNERAQFMDDTQWISDEREKVGKLLAV